MSLNTVMNPHMKNRTVMIANGPRWVGPPAGGAAGTGDSTDGLGWDIVVGASIAQKKIPFNTIEF